MDLADHELGGLVACLSDQRALCPEHDKRGRTLLLSLIQTALDASPTTINEDDEAITKCSQHPSMWRMEAILRYRRDRKALLSNAHLKLTTI